MSSSDGLSSSALEFKSAPEHKKLETLKKIRKMYPDRIPIILESATSELKLTKEKYLSPCDITIAKFSLEIRKQTNLDPNKALFIFINNGRRQILLNSATTVSEVYQTYSSSDGFLYLTVSLENTFG